MGTHTNESASLLLPLLTPEAAEYLKSRALELDDGTRTPVRCWSMAFSEIMPEYYEPLYTLSDDALFGLIESAYVGAPLRQQVRNELDARSDSREGR